MMDGDLLLCIYYYNIIHPLLYYYYFFFFGYTYRLLMTSSLPPPKPRVPSIVNTVPAYPSNSQRFGTFRRSGVGDE